MELEHILAMVSDDDIAEHTSKTLASN